MALQLNIDPRTNAHLWKNYSGGSLTNNPANGELVLAAEEESGSGVTDFMLKYDGGGTGALWRSSSPLLALPCIDFDGSSDWYLTLKQTDENAIPISSFLSTTAFTFIIAFYAETITLAGSNGYDGHQLWCNGNAGTFGFFLRDNSGTKEFGVYFNDGTDRVYAITTTAAARHVAMCRYSSGTISMSMDGGSETDFGSGALGTVTGMSSGFMVGKGFGGSYYNGRMGQAKLFNDGNGNGALSTHVNGMVSDWVTGAGATAVGAGLVSGPTARRSLVR